MRISSVKFPLFFNEKLIKFLEYNSGILPLPARVKKKERILNEISAYLSNSKWLFPKASLGEFLHPFCLRLKNIQLTSFFHN